MRLFPTLRRLAWNIGVALAAPWLEAVVWGIVIFRSTPNSVVEEGLGSALFTVYGLTTPTILLITLIMAAVVKASGRSPSRRLLLVVVGSVTAASSIVFQMWWWFGGHNDAIREDYGHLKMTLAFVLGGVVAGAFAGLLVRVGNHVHGHPVAEVSLSAAGQEQRNL